MTNAFFTELARCLRKQGIDSAIQKDSRLEVFLHGQPALFVSPKNEVFLLPEMSGNDEAGDLYHEVAQISDEVFSYVEAVQSAAHLKANGLSEDFRLLVDFGGAVLAGREREPGWGYQFVTWIWDYGRTGVINGHYYEGDYNAAKQDFAVRSGLISNARLFSDEELSELYRATDYLLENDLELQQDHLKAIQTARTKIEYIVPNLQEKLEPEQNQGQQMN